MALLNTWASQQDPNSLSPLDRALNNYIQQGDAPLAYLMRGDAKGLLQDLNTPKPVNMTQDMTNAALNLNPVMGLIGATAFHGSPYKFDKFDVSKIGSGEGAQMYGHGLYFAENPKVAKYYSNISPTGAEPPTRRALFGNEVEPMTPEYKVSQLVDEMGVNKAKKFISDWAKNPTPDMVDFANKANTLISSITKKSDVKNLGTSNLYKVDIPDTHISSMLDWDKPLGQQAKNVQEAINKTKKNLTEEDIMMLGGDANLLYGKDVTPNQFLNTWEIIRGQKNIGESLLNESGVKGVKYFDNQSREGLKGTRNFVVFDPTDIKILERNNKGLLD